jgi:hypothetical protein
MFGWRCAIVRVRAAFCWFVLPNAPHVKSALQDAPRKSQIGKCLRTQETNRDFGWPDAAMVRHNA